MKQVSIFLNPDVAKAYMQATAEDRKKVNAIVNRWLKNIFFRKKTPKEKLFETMDELSIEAKEKGLNPEILEQILQEINDFYH
ncbi:MAG: hypothetical protein BWY70_01336 [Bacteroidetes bacterium ADurb.Bin408]|nr:MAG: hypothetical protein BWY70_01336 [Bacteroidetes bacterium ADurb.Bin408]